MEEANRCGSDHVKLKDILSSILMICKVFYSLNFQVIIIVTRILCLFYLIYHNAAACKEADVW